MSDLRRASVDRVLSPLERLRLLVLGAVALLGGFMTVRDPDAPWVLRSGELILSTGRLPEVDPFSYTSDKPWLNHEWLSEVLYALAWRSGGHVALALVVGLVLCGVGAALLPPVQGRGRPHPPTGDAPILGRLDWPLITIGATLLLLRESAAPRAQLLSTLLFAITLRLVLRDGTEPLPPAPDEALRRRLGHLLRDPLAATVPLGLLWTQLHGGNPHQTALLGCLFIAGPSLRRAAWAAAAALLTLAGPYGAAVHAHFALSRSTLYEIREWQPLGLEALGRSPQLAGAVALLSLAAVALLLRARRREPVRLEALLLLVFGALMLRYLRFAVESTLVASALLARSARSARDHRSTQWAPVAVDPADREAALSTTSPAAGAHLASHRLASLVTALGLSALVLGWTPLSQRTPGLGFDEQLPVHAADYLRRARPPGPMLNSYNFGGYLLWAYPDERVYVDGRAFTVYSNELIAELLEVYRDPPRFRSLEARHGLRLAVLQRDGKSARLVGWLGRQPDWRLAHEDDRAVIFVRRTPPPAAR